MPDTFILIPGRTAKQGTTLNEGKQTDAYKAETQTLKMNPDDMQRLRLAEGDSVRMWNDTGDVTVPVASGKDELPPGMLFISYGDISSRLMAGETHGSGMPDSKGLDVWVERHDQESL
ncbi:MAG: molybdopterin dinucleotide binding domain-containing protein [Planctomycetaceae bacterium]